MVLLPNPLVLPTDYFYVMGLSIICCLFITSKVIDAKPIDVRMKALIDLL